MTETDLGHLPTYKIELALTIINGSPTYANSAFIIYNTLLLSCKFSSISNNFP